MSETKQHILIVDDEADLLELLGITLSRMGHKVKKAQCVTEAIAALKNEVFSLCITDMKMPDGTGLEVIAYIQQNCPEMPVAMLTAHGDMETAIEALKLGAFDFVNKPIELDRLRQLVNTALTETEDKATPLSAIIGKSTAINSLRSMIEKVSRNQAPVMIHGESGTGKELVARSIHQMGPRANKPFVPINCGAIPSELMESEFFGHIKGSFTGATSNKQGLFEAANGGTLFLDEIADLPLTMQVKLLRAIQERRIRPIGSHSEIDVDVRLLSASHKNLTALVDAGEFRADLFYRLNVIGIEVPALHQRIEDIPLLVKHILKKLSAEHISLTDSALSALCQYAFPGNIRELENILERATTMLDGNVIQADDLKLNSQKKNQQSDSPQNSQDTSFIDLEKHLETIERKLINDALEATRWNRTAAASRLGLSFRSLRYRLKKLGIE